MLSNFRLLLMLTIPMGQGIIQGKTILFADLWTE
jgi:hypothetical protein